MKWLKHLLVLAASALTLSVASPPLLTAQNLDSAEILKPSPDSWPGYHGDYSGMRHSRLTQITPQNVRNLTLAWGFQTNQPAEIKSTPLLVDGVLYFTVPLQSTMIGIGSQGSEPPSTVIFPEKYMPPR